MRKSKKTYKRPQKMWDKTRIERDKKLKKDFGLIREREIWRAETTLRKYRRLARELVALRDKEKEKELISKLVKMGILEEGSSLDDVLGLTVEGILERRLQTVVFRRGLANTPKHARQLIAHGHIKVKGRKSRHPGRIILKDEEEKIEIIPKSKNKKESKVKAKAGGTESSEPSSPKKEDKSD